MFAKTNAVAVVGLEGSIVSVETDIASGLPAFNVVGLPDKAVQESRERVRAAIRNSGCEFPLRRVTAALAHQYAGIEESEAVKRLRSLAKKHRWRTKQDPQNSEVIRYSPTRASKATSESSS
jgi:predicted ATPase with chaperone activity